MSDMEFWILGTAIGVIVGMAKTGIPGMGILAVPLMAMVFAADTKQSVGALLPMLILADIPAVAWYRRHAQWNRLWELFPSVIAGIVLGAVLLTLISNAQMKPFLGALILALLTLELVRKRMGWTDMPHQAWFVNLSGSLAGFTTTVGNVGGPVMDIYLISKGLPKDQFMGTCALYFFIFNCVKVPIYVWQGMITARTLWFDLLMVPAILAGAVLGRWLYSRITPAQFKTVVLSLAALAALRLFFL